MEVPNNTLRYTGVKTGSCKKTTQNSSISKCDPGECGWNLSTTWHDESKFVGPLNGPGSDGQGIWSIASDWKGNNLCRRNFKVRNYHHKTPFDVTRRRSLSSWLCISFSSTIISLPIGLLPSICHVSDFGNACTFPEFCNCYLSNFPRLGHWSMFAAHLTWCFAPWVGLAEGNCEERDAHWAGGHK